MAKNTFNLTAKESEVAALVATGSSNKEIAVELKISIRTVESHMGNIFSKTNCKNRTAVGVWWLHKASEQKKK